MAEIQEVATPGPYHVYDRGPALNLVVRAGAKDLAYVNTVNGYEANALLFAAAPDLLDAAILGLTELEILGHPRSDAAKSLRAAIAKAEVPA